MPQLSILLLAETISSGHSLSVVQILSSVAKDLVKQRLSQGKIVGCGSSVPQLQEEDIDECSTMVGQIGFEPYLAAMERHPDFDMILGGRAYDPSPFVAFALASLERVDPTFRSRSKEDIARIEGGFTHVGKILECGGQCATPKSIGAIATVYEDGTFDVRPTSPLAVCTPLSVAAHTLYEKSRPDLLAGPGGELDLTGSEFTALEDGVSVRVRGSVFRRSIDSGRPYRLKLEAARNRGYRALYMGFVRDRMSLKASSVTWSLR